MGSLGQDCSTLVLSQALQGDRHSDPGEGIKVPPCQHGEEEILEGGKVNFLGSPYEAAAWWQGSLGSPLQQANRRIH